MDERRISVLGIAGDPPACLPHDGISRRLVTEADLLLGAARHLDACAELFSARARALAVGAGGLSLLEALDAIDSEPGRSCFLASGDPGFFGILRALAERFGPGCLDVHPAPSSVSLAFAALGIPWDDAAVVSAHGRSLEAACASAARHAKVAVLSSPENTPPTIAASLLERGASFEHAAVVSALGTARRSVRTTTLSELAKARRAPSEEPSVMVLWSGDGIARRPALAWPASPRRVEWGRGSDFFEHRDGQITKPEVRAVVLAHLALAPCGVLWDLGAGSGSIGVEAASLFPELTVVAVEQDAASCGRIARNAEHAGVRVEIVHGHAPEALEGLPAPDSVFVGGGGSAVLDDVCGEVTPGTRIVATYAALDRAINAQSLLGNLAEVAVSTARALPDGGLRLVAANPVFVAWGDR